MISAARAQRMRSSPDSSNKTSNSKPCTRLVCHQPQTAPRMSCTLAGRSNSIVRHFVHIHRSKTKRPFPHGHANEIFSTVLWKEKQRRNSQGEPPTSKVPAKRKTEDSRIYSRLLCDSLMLRMSCCEANLEVLFEIPEIMVKCL